MDLKNERNLSMLVDFYELTMTKRYYENAYADTEQNSDIFLRKNPLSSLLFLRESSLQTAGMYVSLEMWETM